MFSFSPHHVLVLFFLLEHMGHIYSTWFFIPVYWIHHLSFWGCVLLTLFLLVRGHFFCFSECLLIFEWMPGIVNLMWIDVGFCYISLNSIWLYSGMHLNDLGSVSYLQSRANLASLLRQHPSEDSTPCPLRSLHSRRDIWALSGFVCTPQMI